MDPTTLTAALYVVRINHFIFSTAVWVTAVLTQSVGSEQKLQDFGRLDFWMVGNLTIGLWAVGPFDYNLIQMDSCAINPTAYLLGMFPLRIFFLLTN